MELIYILTYNCNFRCTYCDIDKRQEDMLQSTLERSISFLDSLDLQIDKVKFFWGEPLMKKSQIQSIIDSFPQKFLPNFYITTNSTLVDSDFINFAKKRKLRLTFSIDWNSETTSENRKQFAWKDMTWLVVENTKKYADFIRVNQVITSKNAENFFSNFKFIYDLWVRRFNFLPEYYYAWSKKWLKELSVWFQQILDFYQLWNHFELINLENYSPTAFFNIGLIIDTDWFLYGTNLILSWKFEKYKKILKIWHLETWIERDVFLPENSAEYTAKIQKLLAQEYPEETLVSVKYVDLILSNFCKKFNDQK